MAAAGRPSFITMRLGCKTILVLLGLVLLGISADREGVMPSYAVVFHVLPTDSLTSQVCIDTTGTMCRYNNVCTW